MAQHDPPPDRPVTPPPALPARSPLRDEVLLQQRRNNFKAELEEKISPLSTDSVTTCSIKQPSSLSSPLSPSSQVIFMEIDRELQDTRDRLVSAIYKNDVMYEDLSDTESESGRKSVDKVPGEYEEGVISEQLPVQFSRDATGNDASTHDSPLEAQENGPRIGLETDLSGVGIDLKADLKRVSRSSSLYSQYTGKDRDEKLPPSDILSIASLRQSEYSDVYDQLVKEDKITDAVRRDPDITRRSSSVQGESDLEVGSSAATVSSYDRATLSPVESIGDKESFKAEKWLARGFQSPNTQAAKEARSISKTWDRVYDVKSPPLSVFPPTSTSSTAGSGEYASPTRPAAGWAFPTSPMNNGRDAYGNYISSSTNDRSPIHAPPNSPNSIPRSKYTQESFLTRVPPNSPISSPGFAQRNLLALDRQRSPVHLRGGWELPKTLWNRTSEKSFRLDGRAVPEPGHRGGSNSAHGSHSKHNSWRCSAERAVPSLRSNFSGASTTASTVQDDSNHGQSQGSSLDDVNKVLETYFGIKKVNAVPMNTKKGPIEREDADQRRKDVPTIPSGEVTVVPFSRHKAPQAQEHSGYYPNRPSSLHNRGNQGLSAGPWKSEPPHPVLEMTSRIAERWERARQATPGPPEPPEKLSYRYSGSSQDENSTYSTPESDLQSIKTADLNDLDKTIFRSGPYRTIQERVREEKETKRLQEEARVRREKQEQHEEHSKQQAEEQRRRRIPIAQDRYPHPPSTIDTLRPADPVSQASRRRGFRGAFRRGGMRPVHEQESEQSSSNARSQTTFDDQRARPHTAPTVPSRHPLPAANNPSTLDRPNMNSMEMAFHVAGKVTRFLLAASSNPSYKTYSRRQPPSTVAEGKQGETSMPLRANTTANTPRSGMTSLSSMPGMADIHAAQTFPLPPIAAVLQGASPANIPSSLPDTGKGKGKAVNPDDRNIARTEKRDGGLKSDPDTRLSGTTAVHNSHPIYPPSNSSTHDTLFPTQDEHGNVTVPQIRRPGLRGGGGSANHGRDLDHGRNLDCVRDRDYDYGRDSTDTNAHRTTFPEHNTDFRSNADFVRDVIAGRYPQSRFSWGTDMTEGRSEGGYSVKRWKEKMHQKVDGERVQAMHNQMMMFYM